MPVLYQRKLQNNTFIPPDWQSFAKPYKHHFPDRKKSVFATYADLP